MSVFSNTCTETFETIPAQPSALKSFVSTVLREIRIRRAMREVASLDDAMLQDIGLGPGSIEDAVRHGRC